jgi:hypothetical protein
MRQHLQRLALLSLAGFGLLLAGCNKRYVEVPLTGATLEGTVTYGKEKVLVAMVTVQGQGGASASGFIDEDGRYKVLNVPLGEVSIGVNTDAGKGQMMSKVMARAASKEKGPPPPKVIDVPAKFSDPNTSGITTTIEKGENKYDIVIGEVKKSPKK